MEESFIGFSETSITTLFLLFIFVLGLMSIFFSLLKFILLDEFIFLEFEFEFGILFKPKISSTPFSKMTLYLIPKALLGILACFIIFSPPSNLTFTLLI